MSTWLAAEVQLASCALLLHLLSSALVCAVDAVWFGGGVGPALNFQVVGNCSVLQLTSNGGHGTTVYTGPVPLAPSGCNVRTLTSEYSAFSTGRYWCRQRLFAGVLVPAARLSHRLCRDHQHWLRLVCVSAYCDYRPCPDCMQRRLPILPPGNRFATDLADACSPQAVVVMRTVAVELKFLTCLPCSHPLQRGAGPADRNERRRHSI